MNDDAIHFLQTYAAGAEVAGGWLYGKALQQAALDYSPDSLKRLDALLAQVRDRVKPSRDVLDSPPGRNFASLLAFYVIEIARRLSGADIDWLDRAGVARVLPPGSVLPDTPAARLVAGALDHGLVFTPLGWLEAQLLPDGQAIPAGDYVASVVAQIQRDGPVEWWRAAREIGKLGSWQISLAVEQRPLWPALVSQAAPSTLMAMPPGDLRVAVQTGDRLLETNPEGAAWQVFAYAGYKEQDGARLDAVVVIGATYGAMPMRMKVAFPFVPAREGRRFAILRPALVEANLTVETCGKLGGAMERGIRDSAWTVGGGWNAMYVG